MTNSQAMMSAAMLETFWTSRQKDMIALITPFVMYATASLTTPGEKINTKEVQKFVQKNYAYTDMPEPIIHKVLARRPYDAIKKVKGEFFFIKNIDSEIFKMDKRRRECEDYLHDLGIKLATYLEGHCKREKNFSEKRAIECLNAFFSRYGLQVGVDELASVNISPGRYEIDYYIARYIFECKDENNREYHQLQDLIKGYFLLQAIYIQPENGEIKSATYSGTAFYYDTPFLLDLLGYSGIERESNAIALHEMLKKQNGQMYYFPHIKQEIIDILVAYRYSLNLTTLPNSYRTLDGLNARNYKVGDVDREINLLESILENKFGVIEQDTPEYETKEDGLVDTEKVIGESEIKQYIRENTAHYKENNLENDIKSALAIHRFRNGYTSQKLENCRYIFVTNNYDFTRIFNAYYKKNICNETFQLIISDSDLAALTWVKCGEIGNLPESELLKNAYCALEPIPEMMKRIEEMLQKLKNAGQMQPEQVVALRTSRVFQNEVMIGAEWDYANINEMTVQEAQKKYEEQLIEAEALRHSNEVKETKEHFQMELDQAHQQMAITSLEYDQKLADANAELVRQSENAQLLQKMRHENSRKKADEYAKEKREEWLSKRKKALLAITSFVAFAGICGTVLSVSLCANVGVSVLLIISTVLSAISAYDTVKAKRGLIMQCLEKKANQYQTKVREEKLKEYEELL